MAGDLETSLLRTFVSCARAGSISRAALALNRTQPALSQQLRRLEDIIGRPLVRRAPSGVSLTSAGEFLLPYAERILTLSAEALAGAGRGTGLSGRCGIGLIEDLATLSLSQALADFAGRHPHAALELVTLAGPAMREAYDSGRIQLVLGDVGHIDQPASWSRRLSLVWAASPSFDASLDPLPLALFSQPCRWRAPMLRTLDKAGRRWRVAFESTSLAGVQAGARAGIGVAALLPATILPDLVAAGELHGLPALPSVEIGLVRRPGTEGDMLVDAVEALLLELV